MENKNNLDFVQVSELESKKINLEAFELVEYGKIRNESAPYGDFLSRMWSNFGKPESVMFEGFNYYIKDKKTNITFLAYFGASGPAYAAKKSEIDKLKPRIIELETILDKSKNADCEIEIENDFGTYLCGAKDGVAYDREK